MFSANEKQIVESMEKLIPSLDFDFYETKLSGMDVFEMLDKAQRHQFNVKFQGPTGSGKTTYFEAFCEKNQQPHFVSNMKGSTTSEELIGAFVPNETSEGGRYIWKDGVIVRSMKYSCITVDVDVKVKTDGDGNKTFIWDRPRPNYEIDVVDGEVAKDDIVSVEGDNMVVKAWPRCMLTIEEINFSPEELMSVWFSMLDARRNVVLNEKNGEVVHCGKFLSVNATMNPDYIGTNPLNDALNDRFLIKMDVDYDTKIENKIISQKAKKYGFYAKEVKILKGFVSLIRKGNREAVCDSNISTRMIAAYMDIKGFFGDEVALSSLINSFSDEYREYAATQMDIVVSESGTIDISKEEMEGLNLEDFKGYVPEEKTEKPSAKTPKVQDCPF